MIEQHRSTQRYRAKTQDDEPELVKAIVALSNRHPRYGYRRIAALLRRERWSVNTKRVQRLWRTLGLRIPMKQHKRRRLGTSANSCQRRKAVRRNQVWSYDFVFDRTEDGRQLKFLNIVDEYTRECLVINVARSIKALGVVQSLRNLVVERGAPDFIRSDNGPEFVAQAVQMWLKAAAIETAYIEPGSPWENAYVETFNGKLRDEMLNREIFLTLREAQYLANSYRTEYNHERPHSSLEYKTPAEFARGRSPCGSASLRLRGNARRSLNPVRLS